MSKVEGGGGGPIDPPPPSSRLRVTIFSRRLLGLSVNVLFCSTYTDDFASYPTRLSPKLAKATNSSLCISNDVAALPPLEGKVWRTSKHLVLSAKEKRFSI